MPKIAWPFLVFLIACRVPASAPPAASPGPVTEGTARAPDGVSISYCAEQKFPKEMFAQFVARFKADFDGVMKGTIERFFPPGAPREVIDVSVRRVASLPRLTACATSWRDGRPARRA